MLVRLDVKHSVYYCRFKACRFHFFCPVRATLGRVVLSLGIVKPCRLILEAEGFYSHRKQCFLTHPNRPASPLGCYGSAILGQALCGLRGECKGEDKPESLCLP